MKNPLTQAGIEPAIFRFVAQHLNHCATAVPQGSRGWQANWWGVRRASLRAYVALKGPGGCSCSTV